MSGPSTHKTSSTGKYENTEQHPQELKNNKQKIIDASRSVINMDSGISPNQHEIILRHLEKLEKSSQGNIRNPHITSCGSLSSRQTSIERLAQDLTKSTYDNSSTAQLLQSLSVLQGERSDIPAMRKDIDSLKRSVDSTHTILKHLCVVVMEGNKSSGAEPPLAPNGVPFEEHARVVSEKDEQIQRIKQHAETMFDEYRCHIEKLKDEKALLAGEVVSLKTTMSNVFTAEIEARNLTIAAQSQHIDKLSTECSKLIFLLEEAKHQLREKAIVKSKMSGTFPSSASQQTQPEHVEHVSSVSDVQQTKSAHMEHVAPVCDVEETKSAHMEDVPSVSNVQQIKSAHMEDVAPVCDVQQTTSGHMEHVAPVCDVEETKSAHIEHVSSVSNVQQTKSAHMEHVAPVCDVEQTKSAHMEHVASACDVNQAQPDHLNDTPSNDHNAESGSSSNKDTVESARQNQKPRRTMWYTLLNDFFERFY